MGPLSPIFTYQHYPDLVEYFSSTKSIIQLSLTATTVGLGAGQLLFGPLSDKFGRKRPLMISLIVFSIVTFAITYSNHVYVFILYRLIQGFMAAGGVVISRSVASDLYKGEDLTKFFTVLMLVNGLAPMAAPVLGGIVLKFTEWQGIFLVLFVLGLVLTIVNYIFKETLPVNEREDVHLIQIFKSFIPILKHKEFMAYALSRTFTVAIMFTYISSSSFLFQEYFGLTADHYTYVFALNGVGLLIGGQLVNFIGTKKSLLIGVFGVSGFAIIFSVVLYNGFNVYVSESILFSMMLFVGLILPTSTSLGMNLVDKNRGAASALLGFFPFVAGGIVAPITGLGNIHQTVAIIIVCLSFLPLLTVWYARKIHSDSTHT